MSLLKFVSNTATVVADTMNEKANKIKQLQQEYATKSDDELIKIAKNDGFLGNSSSERSIAKTILRKRGLIS